MIKIANHRPIHKVEEVCKHYSEKDGVDIKYVCTTDMKASDSPADIFYRETPHPEFGNRYFGLWYDHHRGHDYIFNADLVEDLEFGMIEHEGEYYYSQSHHDFVSVTEKKFIDGGREYYRYSTDSITVMKVRDGEFYVETVVTPAPYKEVEESEKERKSKQSNLGSKQGRLMNLEELERATAQWHHDRNLIDGATDKDQYMKLIQEAGELSDNICKGKDIRDDIGDMMVVLINIAERNGLTLKDCLQVAYNDIKDRKGKMIDGVFVKEADL